MIPLAPLLAAVLSDSPPHILLILVDDFGWQNSGWHAAAANASAPSYTPRMDELVRLVTGSLKEMEDLGPETRMLA